MNKKLLTLLISIEGVLLLCYFIDTNWWQTNELKMMVGKVEESRALSERSITAFGQDQKQRIWVGTKSGLNIYYGNIYKQMFCDPADSTTIPDNNILTITKDNNNNMWVGTPNGVAKHIGCYKFKRFAIPYSVAGVHQIEPYGKKDVLVNNGKTVYLIVGNTIKPFYNFEYENLSSNHIVADKQMGFWIITPQKVAHYDKNGRLLSPPINFTANLAYIYKKEDIVVYSQGHRVSMLDLKTNKIIYTSPDNLPIIPTEVYLKDKNHIYLNSAFHGLYVLNTQSNELKKITDSDFHLRHKDITISSFFSDAENNLWVGYQYGGFQVISMNNIIYESYNNKSINNLTRGLTITALGAVSNGLIGSTEDEIFYYTSSNNNYTHYSYKEIFSDSPYYRQTLEDVVPFEGDKVWLLSNVRLLSCTLSNGQINVIGRVYSPLHMGPLLGNGIKVGNEILFTSASPYLLKSSFGASTCDSILVANKLYNNESKLTNLPNGEVLLVMKGLEMASYNPRNNKVTALHVQKSPNLSNAVPTVVVKDKKNKIWIGTRHDGLKRYNIEENKLEDIQEVPLTDILSIQEDHLGLLWICSHDNLVYYNPTDKTAHFSSYPPTYNVNGRSIYYRNSSIIDSSKALICGTSEGCITIPVNLSGNNPRYDEKLSNIIINSITIKKDNGETLGICDYFTDNEQYTFPRDENNISIDFSNANYYKQERMLYQYMLEGYDKDWSSPSLKPSAQYSNLPSGSYTFKVRLVSTKKTQSLSERAIKISIKPAFAMSAAALYFYLLCIVAIIFYAIRTYLQTQKNKLRMEQLTNERQRDKQTNEMNMNFFANVSHEFRNPLTLIAAPLLELKSDEALPSYVRKTLNIVCISVNRMLVLIDQMLDFNKLEADVLQLRIAEHDVATELNVLSDLTAETGKLRNIKVTSTCSETNLYAWVDLDKITKIMSNLFTNALKYTPDNGAIKSSMSIVSSDDLSDFRKIIPTKNSRYLRVSVYNSGEHISQEKLPYVFKRYYQANNTMATHQYGWGTGIGLYYVERLVELHHGEILVRNEPTGGVSFIYVIPIDKTAYRKEEFTQKREGVMQIPTESFYDTTEEKINSNQLKVNETAKKPIILIVEDDTDMAQYIRSLFINDYVVINKYSAEKALEEMQNTSPDIILSDVVMGEMTGYEFCHKVKADLMTCHIPVILITGKSSVAEQVEGLTTGANAYVTKPFNPRYLKAVVDSQLENIKLLRQKLGEANQPQKIIDGLSEQDRKFIDDLYALMEKHISEQDLNVSTISHELLISHSKFNYKLKELTGETPGSFFRKFKLNRAAKLLRQGNYNVSEVAFITGFGTVSYFSVAFKKQFGVSPSEYK